jgi:hypothetical protein
MKEKSRMNSGELYTINRGASLKYPVRQLRGQLQRIQEFDHFKTTVQCISKKFGIATPFEYLTVAPVVTFPRKVVFQR